MKNIKVATASGVTTIELNRSDVHNAFNSEMIAELTSAFRNIESSTRVVILKGQGKSFCAGADLNWMKSMAAYSLEENKADSEKLFEMFEAVQKCPVPVLGRIHGSIFGGGLGLVAACDIVACVRDAKFCFSEVKLGLVPAVISAFVLPKANRSIARQMMLTAQVFDESIAQQMGLVHFVGQDEEVDDFVQSQADFILSNGPLAVRDTKHLLDFVPTHSASEIKNETTRVIAQRRVSAEGQEGMKSFFEKRKPSWKNK